MIIPKFLFALAILKVASTAELNEPSTECETESAAVESGDLLAWDLTHCKPNFTPEMLPHVKDDGDRVYPMSAFVAGMTLPLSAPSYPSSDVLDSGFTFFGVDEVAGAGAVAASDDEPPALLDLASEEQPEARRALHDLTEVDEVDSEEDEEEEASEGEADLEASEEAEEETGDAEEEEETGEEQEQEDAPTPAMPTLVADESDAEDEVEDQSGAGAACAAEEAVTAITSAADYEEEEEEQDPANALAYSDAYEALAAEPSLLAAEESDEASEVAPGHKHEFETAYDVNPFPGAMAMPYYSYSINFPFKITESSGEYEQCQDEGSTQCMSKRADLYNALSQFYTVMDINDVDAFRRHLDRLVRPLPNLIRYQLITEICKRIKNASHPDVVAALAPFIAEVEAYSPHDAFVAQAYEIEAVNGLKVTIGSTIKSMSDEEPYKKTKEALRKFVINELNQVFPIQRAVESSDFFRAKTVMLNNHYMTFAETEFNCLLDKTACSDARFEFAKWLFACSTIFDLSKAVDAEGNTPLMIAAGHRRNQNDLVKAMLMNSEKFNVLQKNSKGRTALRIAEKNAELPSKEKKVLNALLESKSFKPAALDKIIAHFH